VVRGGVVSTTTVRPERVGEGDVSGNYRALRYPGSGYVHVFGDPAGWTLCGRISVMHIEYATDRAPEWVRSYPCSEFELSPETRVDCKECRKRYKGAA
jgi:hypothetical protein